MTTKKSSLGIVNPHNIYIRTSRIVKKRRPVPIIKMNVQRFPRKGLAYTCASYLQHGHDKQNCKNTFHPNSRLLKISNDIIVSFIIHILY